MITTDPAIMRGKPCIAGTRIPVEIILEYLEAGCTFTEILQGYPALVEQDIRDCILYAREHLSLFFWGLAPIGANFYPSSG